MQFLDTITVFSMATEDRYVICQDAAKEMLSVAICDHYNRAKENTGVAEITGAMNHLNLIPPAGGFMCVDQYTL
jgi:ATP-dependent protease Clp ATPase subunit